MALLRMESNVRGAKLEHVTAYRP